MSDVTAGELSRHSWPPPHAVIDAPYGPRYLPATPAAATPGWVREPLPPTPQSRRWIGTFVVICLLIAGLAVVLVVAFVAKDDDPRVWDPRIAPLAAFVETATGATFARPVEVEFLADAEFEKLVSRDPAALTDADRQSIADDEAIGRAFGWYTGDTRLFDENNDLSAAGILAFYTYDKRRIVARADDPAATMLAIGLRVTIVHELTHAMQDQRFGGIENVRARPTTSEGADATLSLIEGHATFVESKYVDALSPADLDAFSTSSATDGAEISDRVEDVPNVLSVPLAAPYVFGPILVDAAHRVPTGIKGLYDTPPVAMDQVLDPLAYFANDELETVDASLPPGNSLPTGTVGPVRLYLTLATVISPADAWDAALGWGNDIYAPFRRSDGLVCVNWNLYGDTVEAAQRLYDGLVIWEREREAAAMVTVAHAKEKLHITMCDPGTATTQTLVSDDAATAFYIRANVLSGLLERTGDLAVATCATSGLFHEFLAPDLVAGRAEVLARTDQLVISCT